MEVTSKLSLESCRYCKGSGKLGVLLGNAIICEGCGGMGLMWIERCALVPPEEGG